MKLNIENCSEYAKEKGIKTYKALGEHLGLSVEVLKLLEQGNEIGYEAVKDIYNSLGEKVTSNIIDFGEETLSGFKSKYILIGDKLY